MTKLPDFPALDIPVSTDPAADPAPPAAVSSARSTEQTARANRLASALRDNLRRRKLPRRPALGGDH